MDLGGDRPGETGASGIDDEEIRPALYRGQHFFYQPLEQRHIVQMIEIDPSIILDSGLLVIFGTMRTEARGTWAQSGMLSGMSTPQHLRFPAYSIVGSRSKSGTQ